MAAQLLAQAPQTGSVAVGNATMAPAASPALEPVLSSAAAGTMAAPAANATSAPGLSVPDAAFAWGGYFEALAWLCFALAVLWLVLWLIKRRGFGFSGDSTPGMRIESRLALGPKKWIIITRYQDRRLILGVTEQQITLLSDLPVAPPEGSESRNKQDKTFAAFLNREDQTS